MTPAAGNGSLGRTRPTHSEHPTDMLRGSGRTRRRVAISIWVRIAAVPGTACAAAHPERLRVRSMRIHPLRRSRRDPHNAATDHSAGAAERFQSHQVCTTLSRAFITRTGAPPIAMQRRRVAWETSRTALLPRAQPALRGGPRNRSQTFTSMRSQRAPPSQQRNR